MEANLFWPAALLAAAFVGMGKGGLPVVGMLGVPVLASVIPPVQAAGLLLPVYVVSDMFGLWAYRHRFDRRVLAFLIPPATLGVGFGWAMASVVSEALVTFVVGLIGAVFALSLILRRGPEPPARRPRRWPALLWGGLAGFTSFVSHAGGPPYQVFVMPLKLEKVVFAGTATIFFACVNAVKLVPYYALGQLSPANLKVAAMLTVPAVLAVFAGVALVRILPAALFFRLVTWALLALSLRLIWQALA